MSKKPAITIKVGLLNFTVWENQTDKGVIKSLDISRSYKKADGKWDTTKSFRPQDIVLLQLGLNKVAEAMYKTSIQVNENEEPEEQF